MQIDMLRRGWPEQILTGRYSFATRRRDGLVQGLFEAVDLLTDGLIDKKRKRRLHLRIGGEPAMLVLKETYPQSPHLPPGIKLCGASPVAALLVLCERRAYRPSSAVSLFEPYHYDVVDHRLGVVIGTLEATGGFVRPARTVIYGPSQQVLGQLTQPVTALIGQWLLIGRNRYDVTVNGVRVARIQQVRRIWVREYQVDVSAAAGLLDPRLILACALQKVRDLGDY
ncbi:hypothetical protein DMB66_20810 [Actinoplanes sp. ATCC 53533]|uniref:hypothetical protein n=1 Tax=Actinoplanes sp. ATCC 53533 TaxID=1288362 RepID=UPI000F769998|nr:hypothetical protein [Actinoplanes sp. ATCC 53533]RSM64341.1 hypothetical protein DMB66_20810 [Actinoplanes sp. ATCC 53533]